MKKGFILLVSLLFVFLISGCDLTPPEISENMPPVVTGDVSLILPVNSDEPDWSKLVIAKDDIDGDILILDSMISSNLDLTQAGIYEVTYIIPDNEGKTTTYTLSVEVVDDRVYTLSLYGADEVDIEVFSHYIDPGVLALNIDGEETPVIVSGTVNTNVVGTYILTYSIDVYEITLTRTVNVVDTIAPVLVVEDQTINIDDVDIDWSTKYSQLRDNYDEAVVVVELEDNVVYGTTGVYTVSLLASDCYDNLTIESFTVTIVHILFMNRTGTFNYRFANPELRLTFMAAAEKYLMNTMYGGVPLFSNGSYELYSPRVQLPVDEHVAVMGYGSRFATMSLDDATVLMYNGQLGHTGEYTYRTTNSLNPMTYNQWLYDTSTDRQYMEEYIGSLYDYVLNADKNGYDVIPSMASDDPIPVDSHFTTDGKEVSKVWQIPIREGLEWSYFNNEDAPTYVTDNSITAEDFVDTFKIAIDNSWFRAISGGGDFINFSHSIKGLTEYYSNADYSDEAWADVGIKVVNDNIQFEFISDQSDWNMRYWLSSFVMSPIHTEMYEYYGDAYGKTPTSIGYTGPYVISGYESDVVLSLEKNPNAALPNLDFYTHKTFQITNDKDIAFELFEAGKLDEIGLPIDKYDTYKDDIGLRLIPGNTTYRIMINGTGTEDALRDIFPNSTWIPEPILANSNFKTAMFFAIDRRYLTEEVVVGQSTSMYLFSNTYLVDAEYGIPYRNTDQGLSVGDGLSPATHGYNFDAAHAFFHAAIETLLAEGTIVAGTAEDFTVISIELNYFSNSEDQVALFEYLKSAFEQAFVDDENFVKVELIGVPKDFPDIYYNHMMVGEFDLSIGGISGSTLDASSFLDTYCSDNRGGFTLNWGIDTSTANIEVTYTDPTTNLAYQGLWSFDAISSILNGETYIIDGAEARFPSAKDITQTPTTVTFTIDKFDSDHFQDFTYSIEMYDDDYNGYLPVEGLTDITASQSTITVTGLTPGFEDFPNMYVGDYQVVIHYVYTEDIDKSGSSISPWWMQPSTVSSIIDNSTGNALNVSLVLHADFNETLISAELLNDDYTVNDATIIVNGLDLTASGLTTGTSYVIKVTYDNGVIDYVKVTTPS